jgi:predicted transcriptional regulator
MIVMNAHLIAVLKRLGFTRIQAQALDYLLNETKWPALTRDIEKGADLRQQEVNMVIRDFVKRGWLEEVKAPSNGTKGKPPFQYRFTLSKGALYALILTDTRKKIAELERLVVDDLNQALGGNKAGEG